MNWKRHITHVWCSIEWYKISYLFFAFYFFWLKRFLSYQEISCLKREQKKWKIKIVFFFKKKLWIKWNFWMFETNSKKHFTVKIVIGVGCTSSPHSPTHTFPVVISKVAWFVTTLAKYSYFRVGFLWIWSCFLSHVSFCTKITREEL